MNTNFTLPNINSLPTAPGAVERGWPSDRNKEGDRAKNSAHAVAQTFGDAIGAALRRVNAAEQEADNMAVKVATDENTDLAAVMIATERAQLTFQLALEVRNKVLESYQELMRMQI